VVVGGHVSLDKGKKVEDGLGTPKTLS